jgi:hypothetical protein
MLGRCHPLFAHQQCYLHNIEFLFGWHFYLTQKVYIISSNTECEEDWELNLCVIFGFFYIIFCWLFVIKNIIPHWFFLPNKKFIFIDIIFLFVADLCVCSWQYVIVERHIIIVRNQTFHGMNGWFNLVGFAFLFCSLNCTNNNSNLNILFRKKIL